MEIDLGIEGISDLEQIGRGGSARVYKAFQPDLDRWVAIKVLHSAWDEGVQRRFERERRAMGRLSDHNGIAQIFATGKTGQDEPYIIMPFYEAGSLAERVDPAEPLDWREATTLIAAVTATMADAHGQGIVHRDIKPANILISPSGQPKVADFGISRLSSSETASQSTALSFTPAFAPPESFITAKATPAVDVYGIAATLFALIAGRPPFTGTDLAADVISVINRVANEPVEDLRPQVPDAICTVIERGMAKKPEDRPADAAAYLVELQTAIAAAEQGLPLVAPEAETQHHTEADLFGAAGLGTAATTPAASSESETVLPGASLFGVPDDAGFAARTTVHGSSGVVRARQVSEPTPPAAKPLPPEPERKRRAPLIIAAAAALILALGGIAFATTRGGGESDDVQVAGVTQSSSTTVTTTVPESTTSTTTELVEEDVAEDDLDEEFLEELDRAEVAAPTAPATTTPSDGGGANAGNDEVAPVVAAPVIQKITLLDLGSTTARLQVAVSECSSLTYSLNGSVRTINSTTCATNHVISLTALRPSTNYRLIAVAVGPGGRSAGSSVSFGTTAAPVDPPEVAAPEPTTPPTDPVDDQPEDTTPVTEEVVDEPAAPAPVVTGLSVSAISDTTARVTYSSAQCTGTEYRISNIRSGSSGYPNQNRCWNDHQLLLGRAAFGSALSPSTQYTVTVSVINEEGTRSAPKSVTFTTLASPEVDVAPAISGLAISGQTESGAQVSFVTDICAGSRFYLNDTLIHSDGYPNNSQCWNIHARSLSNLEPGTRYNVRVEAVSKGGKVSSRSVNFTTPGQQPQVPVDDPPPADDPPADEPVEEDPPADDPPPEDPPAEDPPVEDPPAEDPPAEDPPAEDPPVEDPPAEEAPADDPPPAGDEPAPVEPEEAPSPGEDAP